jgi:hypothetical protein
MDLTKAEKDRFNARVDRKGTNECWEWKGGKYITGYGLFSLRRGSRKSFLAHRISWMIFAGRDIPVKHMICHSCDTRLCVNPSHLYCGTGYENNQDTINRGRGNRRKGDSCPWSKITEKDALYILASTEKQSALAKRFGVDPSTICQIKAGKRWKHLSQKIV